MSERFGNLTTTPIKPDVFGGTGGNITVDQTYDPLSQNAQSGKAIAGIIGNIGMLLDNIITLQEMYITGAVNK